MQRPRSFRFQEYKHHNPSVYHQKQSRCSIPHGNIHYFNTANAKSVKISHLLILFLLSSARRKQISVLASCRVVLMLNCHLGNVSEDVLNVGILLAAVLAAKVVERWDSVHEVVNDGDDNGDTDRVAPDDNDGDNINPTVTTLLEAALWVGWEVVEVARQPAEETEQGCDDIDTEDGAHELPRWKSLAATSDEDQPILSEGDFKEQDFLNVAKVLHNTAVWQEESATNNPRCQCKQNAEHDRDDPNLGQLPFDRTCIRVCVIVSDSDGGKIGEEGDEDDKVDGDGLVDDDHAGHQVDLQVQAKSDTVLNVCLHALENLTSGLDGQHDRGETWSEENDISGGLSGFRRTFDGNTAVGLLQRWSVVDTCESIDQRLHYIIENASKTYRHQSWQSSDHAVATFRRPDTCARGRLQRSHLLFQPNHAELCQKDHRG